MITMNAIPMKIVIIQAILVSFPWYVSNVYAMQTNRDQTISTSLTTSHQFSELPHELRGHIFNHSQFFDRQLKRHRSDKLFCDEKKNPCEGNCFAHHLSSIERVNEITDTLQLALNNYHSDDATHYIVWYELGRIRKNPQLVESMQTPNDWQAVLFAHKYSSRKENNVSPFFEHITTALERYGTPPRSHLYYLTVGRGDEFNKAAPTAESDFVLLLEPSLSIQTEPKNKKDDRIVRFSDGGKTLIQHSSAGWSVGYSLPTGEKSWHIQELEQYADHACGGNTSFPFVRCGKGGIAFIESSTKPITQLCTYPVDHVALSSDNKIVWGLGENSIIFLDTQNNINKKINIDSLLNNTKKTLEIHAHPSEPETLLIKVSPADRHSKDAIIWKAFKVKRSDGDKITLQDASHDDDSNETTKLLLQKLSINNWNQEDNQFVPTPRAVWRAKNAKEWSHYNTLFSVEHPSSAFYYIDSDKLNLYDERYNAVVGTDDNTLKLYHLLPNTFSPTERLILEATRSYSNQENNLAAMVQFSGNDFITTPAQRLCATLQRSSNNKKNVALMSKIIHDNVVIPSKLESAGRLVSNNSYKLAITCFLGIMAASYTLFPMYEPSYVGKICAGAIVTLMAGGMGYGVHRLLSNETSRGRYIHFKSYASIPYRAAEE